jgi:hypothetical protein
MLGFYENFPVNIHRIEAFTTPLSSKRLQRRLIQVLHDVNRRKFSFEEVAYPTVPECTVIFETGLAEDKNFNYIDEEEKQKVLSALRKASFQIMDFFCAIRYYKGILENKAPLKFDYYLLRVVFVRNNLEIQVFHERGPRYISPEDIISFLVNEVNKTSSRKTLKKSETRH